MIQSSSFSSRLKRSFTVAEVFLMRDFKLWTYFKVDFMMSLVDPAAMAIVYCIIAGIQRNGRFLEAYGNDFIAFIIIGLAANSIMAVALSAPYQGLMESFWSNRLEMLLTAPISLPVFLVSSMLGKYIREFIFVALYLVIGIVLFHISLHPDGALIYAPIILVLAVGSCTGLGLLSASMVYYMDARGGQDPIRFVVGIIAGLASGAFFPLQILPHWAQWLACSIPQTFALDAFRRVLMDGRSSSIKNLPIHYLFNTNPIISDCILMLAYSLILLPIGWHFFRNSILIAKKDGRLSRWA